MREKEERFGYEIRRLDNAIKKHVESNLKEKGIDKTTLMNGFILKYLYDNQEKEVYQRDIEKHFNIGRSTVTGLIKMLEQEEYIRRDSVENDARLKRVILMPKGEEVHKAIAGAFISADTRLTEGITPEERDVFFQILEKLIKNLDSKER